MIINLAWGYCVTYLVENLIFDLHSKVCTHNIRINGQWSVGLLVFRTIGVSEFWDVPIWCAKSEPNTVRYFDSLEYTLKLPFNDCACCHSKHRTNLVPFPN